MEEGERLEMLPVACLLACPLGAGVQAFGASGPAEGWRCSSGRVFPAFCPLCCFACGGLLANMALFRVFRAFLEGLMGFVWVCVGWALCVACGAFVCVSG